MCGIHYYPAGPQSEQRIARFSGVPTHRAKCHRECLDPLFRVERSRLEMAEQFSPYRVGLAQNVNVFWFKLLKCWMVHVGVTNDHSTTILPPKRLNT